MIKEEFLELRNVKGEPCISIIVPTHRISPDKECDPIVVDKAINKALHLFIGKYGEQKAEYFINKLNRLSAAIDFVHDTEGLGIFLSKDISKVVKFPYVVSEKVIVGDEFETRDLVYSTRCLFDYYFLMLSRKSTRLFKGYGDIITEVVDENFPREHKSDYEYEKAYIGSSDSYALKGEEDKSIIEERRVRTFFMNVDYFLFLYLRKNTPLFVTGVNENLAIFKHITNYGKNIAAFREGNYEKHNSHELSEIINIEIKKYIDRENEVIIKQFKELIGSGKVIWGIGEAWKAANEGRVNTLLVEKDYMCPAILATDGKNLYPDNENNIKKGKHLGDAVNDIINLVINKGGDVIFTENDKLTAFDRLAVILRY